MVKLETHQIVRFTGLLQDNTGSAETLVKLWKCAKSCRKSYYGYNGQKLWESGVISKSVKSSVNSHCLNSRRKTALLSSWLILSTRRRLQCTFCHYVLATYVIPAVIMQLPSSLNIVFFISEVF